MRILITGSSGQIGTNLALRLLRDGHEVFGIDKRLNTWTDAFPYLLQDLWYAQAIEQYGYVKGVGLATLPEPRLGLHDDFYFTDGLRIVIWVAGDPVSVSEIRQVKWERPPIERRKMLLGQ